MNVRRGLVVRHKNGNVYTVVNITNAASDRQDEYPTTVHYIGADGKEWSRTLERFTEKSFTVLYDGTRKVREDEVTKHPVLDLPLDPEENDAEATSIRGYLGKLLATVWEENEQFSGKHPFGNSGWDYDLMAVLIKHGLIEGKLDDWDSVLSLHRDEEKKGHKLIADAIKDMVAGK